MGSLIAYYPGRSFIHRLDPRVKIVIMLIVSTLIFTVQRIYIAGMVLVVVLALWLIARLPMPVLGGLVRALLPIIAFLFIVQAIFYPGNTPLIKPLIPIGAGIGEITLEGVLFAVLLALRLIAMIILLPLVSYTTTVQKLSLGLVRLGMPYKLAFTTTTALNMVPILQAETGVIVDAQRLRAMQSFEKGKLGEKLRAYPALVTPLVIGSMRRAQLMAVAMDSRAFGASKSRTYLEDIQMQPGDWLFLVSSIIFAVGISLASARLPILL
ncbi:MAG TPA: energy-coupling factor transporter transmembrane component T [Anaerolineaceae bacterium]|nr:energy-coupling factor transporter transmembrane component T [Anaerolineaceae bacterium]